MGLVTQVRSFLAMHLTGIGSAGKNLLVAIFQGETKFAMRDQENNPCPPELEPKCSALATPHSASEQFGLSEKTSPVYAPQAGVQKQSITGWIETWLVWRLCSLGPWYWLLGAVVHKATGKDLLPSSGWIFFTPLFTVFYLLVKGQRAQIIYYPVYLLTFPVTLPTVLMWRTPGLSRKLFLPVTNLLATFCFLVAMMVTWVILLTVENGSVVFVTILVEVILNTLLLISGLRWASDPLQPFLMVVQWLESFLLWVQTSNLAAASSKEQQIQTNKNNLDLLNYFERRFLSATEKIDYLVQRTIVPLFTLILLMVFLITVTGYGITIYACLNLPEPGFNGLEPGFLDSWGYSLTIITTSPLANVKPENGLARFLYSMELFSTFLLVSLFFSMFSAAMGVHAPYTIQDLNSVRRRIHAWIEKQRERLQAEVIDGKANQPGPPGAKGEKANGTAT